MARADGNFSVPAVPFILVRRMGAEPVVADHLRDAGKRCCKRPSFEYNRKKRLVHRLSWFIGGS